MKKNSADSAFGYAEILDQRLEILSRTAALHRGSSEDTGEADRAAESALRRILRDILPMRFGIGTGFVVSVEDGRAVQSVAQDLVIYDQLNNAPLLNTPDWSLFPIEMVYATITVAARWPRPSARQKDGVPGMAQNVATLRAMARHKSYMLPSDAHDEHGNRVTSFLTWTASQPPRQFLFVSDHRGRELARLRDLVVETRKETRDFFFDGIFVANRRWFLACRAYRDPGLVFADGDNAWSFFLNGLLLSIETATALRPYNRFKYAPHLGRLFAASEVEDPQPEHNLGG